MAQTNHSMMQTDQNHTRINNTLLGGPEKKALLWMAARTPDWVTPDTLTLIGLLASFLIFFSYALTLFNHSFLWLASFGFVLQWFGDSMDGTLARYRKIERPRYGFFVDHVIDSISETLIFLGLGLSPYLRFDLALLALVSYLLLSTYVYLVTYVNGIFRISYARLGPTETRVLAILGNTLVFFAGNPLMHLSIRWPTTYSASLTAFDLIAIFFMTLVTGFFIYSTITTAMSLSVEDRTVAREKARTEKANRVSRRQFLKDNRQQRKVAAQAARKGERASIRLDVDPD